jgi:hypothetical protein
MSTNPRATVVGVFREREMAEQALNALKDGGFDSNQIHYSGSNSGGGFFKSLFSGQNTTNDDFVNDLADMGVPDDETRYYANEYNNGQSIIAVNAPGNIQEALNIMKRYGAYNSYNPASSGTSQPANYAQQGTPRPVPGSPPVPQQVVSPQAPPPPPQTPQTAQENQQAPDKLQALQAQLETTQKQLQDAHAQLQATKQREAQMQAARQHDAQILETQKRLQDTQAQLQATLAELRATQARVGESNQ